MSVNAELRAALADDRRTDAMRILGALDERAQVDDALDVLAAAASAGDALATALLVETLHDRGVVQAAVRRYLFDDAAVEDVAQDTLLSIAAGARSFRGDARCTTWVFTIARNRVTDHLRRARRTEQLDDDLS
jgi:DNA-directed RNA polymerase specialized sigma24 family protein